MTDLKVVWVLAGVPKDPRQPEWPVTCHDLSSKRLRCQYAPRDLVLSLGEWNGMSKMSARWCPNVGDRGEWMLVDLLPDNATEAA